MNISPHQIDFSFSGMQHRSGMHGELRSVHKRKIVPLALPSFDRLKKILER
jgi:hypothetical protein